METVEIEAMKAGIVKGRLQQLLDPLFWVALGLLLLNDHVWKTAYGNFWTGKLSDFAGLYAFGWLLMAAWPRQAWKTAALVAVAFMFWKSPLSSPWLHTWNTLGILPLERVMDYGDWAAILVLPIAALRMQRQRTVLPLHRRLAVTVQVAVLALSVFAFCATSYSDEYTYDNHYDLPITVQEAIDRLNALNDEKDHCNPVLSRHYENANEFPQEGNYRLYQHHNQTKETLYDTLYGKIDDSIFIEEIREYEVPAIDSVYLNPEGIFLYTYELRPKLHVDTLTQCQTVPALLKLEAAGKGSRIHLIQIKLHNCNPLPDKAEKSEDPAAYLRTRFEEEVVARLKTPAGS